MLKGAILIGNNASYKIAGIGTVCIKVFGTVCIKVFGIVVRTLGDIRHVSDLKRNLIPPEYS